VADWSTPGSTPLICPRSVPPALKPGPARGLPVPPGTREWLHLDIDAAITIDHSDNKQDTAPTWKKTFGHHPLLVFLDRPETAGGEPLAVLRPGNVGPTTAADNVTILGWVVDSLPTPYRPNPDDPGAQQILVRSDSVGAIHTRCAWPRWGSPSVCPVDAHVRDAVEILNGAHGWSPPIDSARHPRRRLGR
jgi:hypothetical protein